MYVYLYVWWWYVRRTETCSLIDTSSEGYLTFDGNTLGNTEMSQHNRMNSIKVDNIASVILGRPLSSSINSVDTHCYCSQACRAQDGQGSYMEVIIIIYLSWIWATCWPVTVSRIQKSLQRSAMIPSASWGIVFFTLGNLLWGILFTCTWRYRPQYNMAQLKFWGIWKVSLLAKVKFLALWFFFFFFCTETLNNFDTKSQEHILDSWFDHSAQWG
jgi:hypothetical protein